MGDHKAISIFAVPASYRRRRRSLYRGSSMIRGEQVASYLGCKFNPEYGYENDLCIHVKPTSLEAIKDGDWVDIVDGDHIAPLLKERPLINVIINGETSYDLYRPLMGNKMTIIHPHHCNFGRERRTRTAVDTVGYIGSEGAFGYPLEDMKKIVESTGLNFVYCCDYRSREEVVDFYKQIDIQLVWADCRFNRQSRGPTKFINAASFGIPTVGYPQKCCEEIEGNYIKATSIEGVLAELVKLKDDPVHYASWTNGVWTEDYHISRIAELYRGLA